MNHFERKQLVDQLRTERKLHHPGQSARRAAQARIDAEQGGPHDLPLGRQVSDLARRTGSFNADRVSRWARNHSAAVRQHDREVNIDNARRIARDGYGFKPGSLAERIGRSLSLNPAVVSHGISPDFTRRSQEVARLGGQTAARNQSGRGSNRWRGTIADIYADGLAAHPQPPVAWPASRFPTDWTAPPPKREPRIPRGTITYGHASRIVRGRGRNSEDH